MKGNERWKICHLEGSFLDGLVEREGVNGEVDVKNSAERYRGALQFWNRASGDDTTGMEMGWSLPCTSG